MDMYNRVKRRDFLKSASLLSIEAGFAPIGQGLLKSLLSRDIGNPEVKPPMNIVVLFADQMHGFAMGCMGHPDVKTPNLDRLAAEGVLFRKAYSNCPLCTPFRCNLMTSRYGSQTGVMKNGLRIPEGERTFADAFNDGGYRTSYVGKWHLGAKGNIAVEKHLRGGFADFIGYQAYNNYIEKVWFFDENCRKHISTNHRTVETTDIAIERLRKIAHQPFFMMVSYQNPHYPEQPSLQYEKMYANLKPTRRPNCTKDPKFDPYTPTKEGAKPPKDGIRDYKNDLDQYLRQYYAMVTELDANVGRFLETIDQLGLRDKTVVIFTADHGDMQGSHGLKNKRHPYEESTRIPMIVCVPGGVKGQVSDYLVSGIDIFPTCLTLAGLPKERTCEGNDFSGIVMGQKIPDKPIFSEQRDWAIVCQGKYKLVLKRPSKITHLFDLKHDPYEQNNLIDSAQHADVKQQLLKIIKKWNTYVTG
jgi:arylsulfatase A-like enzyme